MSPSDLRECLVEVGGRESAPLEPLIVPYLVEAAWRCDEELLRCSDEEIKEALSLCRTAAIRIIGSVTNCKLVGKCVK